MRHCDKEHSVRRAGTAVHRRGCEEVRAAPRSRRTSCATPWLMRCARKREAAVHTGLSLRLYERMNCSARRCSSSSPSSGNLVLTTATSAARPRTHAHTHVGGAHAISPRPSLQSKRCVHQSLSTSHTTPACNLSAWLTWR